MKENGIKAKEFLPKVPLFAGLSAKELNKLSKAMQSKKYKKGSYLFFENDKGREMFLIASGLVKVYKSDNTGRVKTLSYLREGDFFGEMALLDIEVRSASAQFLEDSEVMVLDGRFFKQFVLDHPEMTLRIMKTLSARLRETNKQIEDLTFHNLPGRVASSLIKLAEKHGKAINGGQMIMLELTHQEIADLVGTAREVVTSILNAFKKAGCIVIHQHKITIMNKEELASWIV